MEVRKATGQFIVHSSDELREELKGIRAVSLTSNVDMVTPYGDCSAIVTVTATFLVRNNLPLKLSHI